MQRLIFSLPTVFMVGCLLFTTVSEARGDEPYFGSIGEGFTAANASGSIDVAWRMFSIPDIPAICASAERPAQLIARKEQIEIMVGEIFSLRDISVIAVDSAGGPLKPIPIILDTDANVHELIDICNYRASGAGILALQPGTFRIWIRPLCTGPGPNPCKGVFIRYIIKAK